VKDRATTKVVKREDFRDGSAVLTYEDGSMLILESKLAKTMVFQAGRRAHYDKPPPPPAGNREAHE
jgi:hypothetical protein